MLRAEELRFQEKQLQASLRVLSVAYQYQPGHVNVNCDTAASLPLQLNGKRPSVCLEYVKPLDNPTISQNIRFGTDVMIKEVNVSLDFLTFEVQSMDVGPAPGYKNT